MIAAAAVSLLGGAVLSVASSFRSSSDDLFMANVEALSDNEDPTGNCSDYCVSRDGFLCYVIFSNGNEKYCFNYVKK